MSDQKQPPDRIWCIKGGATNSGGHKVDFFSQRGEVWGNDPSVTEYVRADLCTPAPDVSGLLQALRAIIERWDTPAWKDAEPTGAVIDRATAELAKWEGR